MISIASCAGWFAGRFGICSTTGADVPPPGIPFVRVNSRYGSLVGSVDFVNATAYAFAHEPGLLAVMVMPLRSTVAEALPGPASRTIHAPDPPLRKNCWTA